MTSKKEEGREGRGGDDDDDDANTNANGTGTSTADIGQDDDRDKGETTTPTAPDASLPATARREEGWCVRVMTGRGGPTRVDDDDASTPHHRCEQLRAG
jgi:hypothetical protein